MPAICAFPRRAAGFPSNLTRPRPKKGRPKPPLHSWQYHAGPPARGRLEASMSVPLPRRLDDGGVRILRGALVRLAARIDRDEVRVDAAGNGLELIRAESAHDGLLFACRKLRAEPASFPREAQPHVFRRPREIGRAHV